jgi:hypothetical protein
MRTGNLKYELLTLICWWAILSEAADGKVQYFDSDAGKPYPGGSSKHRAGCLRMHRDKGCLSQVRSGNPLQLCILIGNDLVDSVSNRCSLATYVRPNSYNKPECIASFEDLLRSQTDLLAGFEDPLHIVPADRKECYQFISSYGQLLRSQTVLLSRFRNLLVNSSGLGWSENLLAGDQIAFSLELRGSPEEGGRPILRIRAEAEPVLEPPGQSVQV